MRVEDVKRWHWCLIGLFVGTIFAAISMWSGPSEPKNAETIFPSDFERQLREGRDYRGRPIVELKNIKLHPATEVFNPDIRATVNAEFITYDAWVADRRKNLKVPVSGHVLLIRGATRSAIGDVTQMTAKDYLLKLKEYMNGLDKTRYPNAVTLNYKVAWLEDWRVAYPAYAGAGVLIIGIIWPTILNILVGAGFGRAPREEGVDLRKYKSKAPDAKPAAKPVVTDDDMDKLRDLEAQLEASLKDGALAGSAKGKAGGTATEAPIKKLSGGPVEPPKAEETKKPEAPKDFGVQQEDFYPTEVHGKKK